jgi:hypothetical protein
MGDSKSKNVNGFLGNYYASDRAAAFMNYDNDIKSIIQDREFGRVSTEYKDCLVVIDGENKKEHKYLIPISSQLVINDNFINVHNYIQNQLNDKTVQLDYQHHGAMHLKP